MLASSSEELSKDEILFNLGGQTLLRDNYQQDIMDWVAANKIGITEVDCDEFIFKKILTGDKSDNIFSVVTWQKEMKNGKLRNYSITDKTADIIWDNYIKEYNKDFTIDFLFSSEAKDVLVDIIYRVVGHSSQTLIKTNLTQNIALMLLHNKTIPDPIQKAIYNAIEKDWEGAIENKNSIMDMNSILEGTDWLEGAKKNSYAPDPFSGMDIPKEEKIVLNQKSPMKLVGKKTKINVQQDVTKKLF
tara:strand:- start:6 stop:740 length:735 start_codon:yes stop_codon:yes gene_type:complete